MQADTLSDEQLVAQILAGNIKHFDELYRRNEHYLKAVITNTLLAHRGQDGCVETDDLFADVARKIFISLQSFNPSKAKFRTWATRIAINHTFDWLRKARIPLLESHPMDKDEEGPDLLGRLAAPGLLPLDAIAVTHTVNTILAVMQKCGNENLRGYLIGRFLLGISEKELASLMDVTPSSVRSNLSRAVSAFSEALRSHPDFKDADLTALSVIIREGALHLTQSQIDRVKDTDLAALLSAVCLEHLTFKEAATRLGLEGDAVKKLARKALCEIARTRIARHAAVVRNEELTERELSDISSYIDLALQGNAPARKIRAAAPDALGAFKPVIDLLAGVASLFSGAGPAKNLGDVLLECAQTKKRTLDQAANALGLDAHTFSRLLTNDVPPELKGDKAFAARIAQFLGVSTQSAGTLLAVARPATPSAVTRQSRRKSSGDQNALPLMRALVKKLYPPKK